MINYKQLQEKGICWTGYKRKKGTKPYEEGSCVKEEVSSAEKHHAMVFGRMNPVTTGHEAVVNKLHSVAKEHNAGHSLVVSHSQDAKKNPLSSEQKVKHAKHAFPDTNVSASSKDKPTILHHAAELHKQGVSHLHVVAGSDRHKDMHELLHKYNDKESGHGHYNFKKITVHSSGERDPDSEGTSGMSASKMREHAASGNKAEFHKGAPSKMKPEHKDAMYNDVRKGMNIKEETVDQQADRAMQLKRFKDQMTQANGPQIDTEIALDKKEKEAMLGKIKVKKTPAGLSKEDQGALHDVNETLRPEMGAGTYINDFIKSTNPRFNNKSKEERRRMAIGAYMAAKAKGVKEETVSEAATGNPGNGYHGACETPDDKYEEMHKHVKNLTDGDDKTVKHYLDSGHGEKLAGREDDHDHIKSDFKKFMKYYRPEMHSPKPAVKEEVEQIDELSTDLLAKYKTAAHASAKASDAAGNYKKGDKRFSGINKATRKQFDNDLKKHGQFKEDNSHYDEAEEHLSKANDADAKGDKKTFHAHMADHHDSMSMWHDSKGRSASADKHAEKAEFHHEKSLSEGTIQPNGTDKIDTATSAPTQSTSKDTTMGKKVKGFKFFKGENDKQMNASQPVKEEAEQVDEKMTLVHGVAPAGHNNKPTTTSGKKPVGPGVTSGTVYTGKPASSAPAAKPATAKPQSALDRIRSGMKKTNEEVEELDELKISTLGSYVKKAALNMANHASKLATTPAGESDKSDMHARKVQNRQFGIKDAVKRLTKEGSGDDITARHKHHHAEMMAAMKAGDKQKQQHHSTELNKAKQDWAKHQADAAKNNPKPMSDIEKDYKKQEAKHGIGHVRDSVEYPEDIETLDEKSVQARRNKTWKNLMATAKGARINQNTLGMKPSDTGHKNARDMNKAIGRAAIRGELDEGNIPQKGVNVDKVNATGQEPHEEKWEPAKKVTKLKKVKEESMKSYKEFLQSLDEVKMADLPSRKIQGKSYGADYTDPEGSDDAWDKDKVKKPAGGKRGRPAGRGAGVYKARATMSKLKQLGATYK